MKKILIFEPDDSRYNLYRRIFNEVDIKIVSILPDFFKFISIDKFQFVIFHPGQGCLSAISDEDIYEIFGKLEAKRTKLKIILISRKEILKRECQKRFNIVIKCYTQPSSIRDDISELKINQKISVEILDLLCIPSQNRSDSEIDELECIVADITHHFLISLNKITKKMQTKDIYLKGIKMVFKAKIGNFNKQIEYLKKIMSNEELERKIYEIDNLSNEILNLLDKIVIDNINSKILRKFQDLICKVKSFLSWLKVTTRIPARQIKKISYDQCILNRR
jgi:hypothetical protein